MNNILQSLLISNYCSSLLAWNSGRHLDSGWITALAESVTVPSRMCFCILALIHVLSHFSIPVVGLSQSVFVSLFRWDFCHFGLALQVCSSGAIGQSDWWVMVTDFLLPHSLITFNLASRSLDVAFLANDFVRLGSEMNKATWAETNMGAEEAIRAAVNTVWGSTACCITENQIIHYHCLVLTDCTQLYALNIP